MFYKHSVYSNYFECTFIDPEFIRSIHEAPINGNDTPFNYSFQFLFKSTEQFFHAAKSLLFKDFESLNAILSSNLPRVAKQIGRRVKNFDEKTWSMYSQKIMIRANYLKFTQNPKFKEKILSDGHNKNFAECSTDLIWGTGMCLHDVGCQDQLNWRGRNLLGLTLDMVRIHIIEKTVPELPTLY